MSSRPRLLAAAVLACVVLTALPMAVSQAVASDVQLDQVLDGYARPTLVTNARKDREIFIVEQGGPIRRAVFTNGAWQKAGVFLDISDKVDDPTLLHREDHGLLGLAFSPDYGRNGLFYVDYVRPDGAIVIAEYRRATSTSADPSSERIVLVIDQQHAHHEGGTLAFGPDKRLYISTGDGGAPADADRTAQDPGSLLGKILRIDPKDPSGPDTYVVPASNPYVGTSGRDEIWARGLRNPWIFSFDMKTADLWIGDVGEAKREEVDRSRPSGAGKDAGKGANYGWSDCEGSLEFNDGEGDADSRCDGHQPLPLYEYGHSSGWCSVTGGFVYRGPENTAWRGLYVAGDWCGGLFVLDGDGNVRLSKVTNKRISSFGQDAKGRLFVTDVTNGNVYRVTLVGARP